MRPEAAIEQVIGFPPQAELMTEVRGQRTEYKDQPSSSYSSSSLVVDKILIPEDEDEDEDENCQIRSPESALI